MRSQWLSAWALVLFGFTAACGSTVATGTQVSQAAGGGVNSSLGSTPDNTTVARQAGAGTATNRTSSDYPPASTSAVGGSVAAPGGQATSGPAARTNTKLRGPISVGFLVSNWNKAVSAALGTTGSSADMQAPFRALVAALNARGGLAGRRITPVYYEIDGSAASYASESQAACAAFTEDHHVEAVVSMNWIEPNFNQCLLKAGVPQYDGSQSPGDDEAGLARTPELFSAAGIATDRYAAAVIDQMVATGWLSAKNKVGVLDDSCAYDQRAYQNVVLPRARRYGFRVEEQTFQCLVGFGDLSAIARSAQNAALQFRAHGVDRVMYLSGAEGAANYLFADNADSQGWHPGYMLSSNVLMQDFQANIPKGQLPNMHGVGWAPVYDVDSPPVTAADQTCLAMLKAGGGRRPDAGAGSIDTYGACSSLFLLEAALKASGGVGGLGALGPATERLGTGYASAIALSGRTRFGPDRHDGGASAAVFTYQAGCGCFRYTRAPQTVP